jgi:hypothetical protein
MAEYPWASGPLLVLLMTSVIHGYVRTTALWETTTAPERQREPRPELV